MALLLMPLVSLAVDPAEFRIEIIPETFQVDEPVDLKITALAADGTVLTDYSDSIFMTINMPQVDYVVPSNGIYVFTAEDQ